MILETQRLRLREMTQADFPALCAILQDGQAMYAYEHAFSDQEVQDWLEKNQNRYRTDGFGLWAVIAKDTGELIGQCGITLQEIGEAAPVPEVGYLFRRDMWHQGYASEAAQACRDYAFSKLGVSRLFSIIRDSNLPSQKVALRNGMTERGRVVKRYYNMDMPHLLFCITRQEWQQLRQG